jgi:hypothetical protein
MTTPDPSLPPPDLDPAILNQTLDLTLEWGEHFAKPTQPRLAKLHAQFSETLLDAYDAAVRVVMSRTFAMLYDSPETDRISVERFIHAKHPWVDASNIARMHSQGTYYASR